MSAEAAATVDLYVLLALAVTALLGAVSGALRQVVSLAAAGVAVLAARTLSHDVGEGLARTLSPSARPFAPLLLFVGVFSLASLAGSVILRATGVARAVRGPADRAAGAVLGGAKGALAAWVLLSVVVLARELLPARVAGWVQGSDFVALARAHNLVAQLDPEAARKLEGARVPQLPKAPPLPHLPAP